MTVAFDSVNVIDSTINGTITTSITPVGTPKGVVVFIWSTNATDEVSGATYGGVTMTEISGSPLIHSTGEDCILHAFFLGSGVLSGTQDRVVTTTAGTTKRIVTYILTGSDDLEIVDSDFTINSDSLANPSVTLSLGGRSCWCAIHFGAGTATLSQITPLTNWTPDSERAASSQSTGTYRYDIVGTTDVTAGWTQNADDATMIALAISEVQAVGGTTNTGWFQSKGGWF